MAGTLSDESGVGSSSDGISNAQQQRCQAGEALAAWRSSEQVENGTPSTSPPFWNADDDDDCGPKPSALYKKYTWKIANFSEINKRELRSDAFEIGGYKWYILIYPQGCDVCNHLSLFLCVANHDDLLPGWSHFAQFTIAVANKDPKKSKYSDTLHRFWKKEHDWGWKKFMEISKVVDGFIDSGTLTIKAQVQVIRERVDRPFRCLDTQYRRELVRVYLSNVEQICRRFLEKIRMKIGGIIDDAPRWSSFCTYWLGIDVNARRSLSSNKKDSQMFKEAVKELFIEKEVTSTLVMDSLYSGIKSLEGEIKNNKVKSKYFDEQVPMPIVLVDKDTFVLVEDVVILLEKAAVETLPPKDEKGIPNHMKDGSFGEDLPKDSFERDERRLTEIGRRTVEIIVTEYIFRNKIEVAYQETVALKNQEELLREEEAAWLAVSDQKAKRGAAAEKEKKSKKKQGKQKRNNRKGKDKGRDVKPSVEEKRRQESRADENKEFMSEVAEVELGKPDMIGDVSDMSDSVECGTEDRESSPINWDTDASDVHHPPIEVSGDNGLSAVTNGGRRKSPSLRDDSSSTCSTDSIPSVVINGSYKGDNSLSNKKTQKSPIRGWSQRVRETSETSGWTNDTQRQTSECLSDAGQTNDVSANCQVAELKTEAVLLSLQDRVKRLEQHMVKKEEVSLERKLTIKDDVNMGTPLKKNTTEVPSPKKLTSPIHLKTDSKITEPTHQITIKKPDISDKTQLTNKEAAEPALTSRPITPKPTGKQTTQQAPPVPTQKPTTPQVPTASRSITPVVSVVQPAPPLSRSASSAGRLGPDPSPTTHGFGPLNTSPAGRVRPDPSSPPTHSYSGPQNTNPAGRLGPDPSPSIYNGPQSYRNAMMGNSVNSTQQYSQPPALVSAPMMDNNSVNLVQSHSPPPPGNSVNLAQAYSQLPPTNSLNLTQSYSQPPASLSVPVFLPSSSERTNPNAVRPSLSYGMVNNLQNYGLYRHAKNKSQDQYTAEVPVGLSQRQNVMADDFPHLDIINELLDDGFQSFSNGPLTRAHNLTRQYTFPGQLSMLNDAGPSTTSSRLFERTRSYNDNVFEQGYPHSNNIGAYLNGRIDGTVPNQWQMNGSDLSYLSLRNREGEGYPYHMPGYSNIPYGVDGYTVYRP